jgi:hypothetical protein
MFRLFSTVTFFLIVCLFSCKTYDTRLSQSIILKQIENGTDSTYNKIYFPGYKHTLYETKTSYFLGESNCIIYYLDQEKKKVDRIESKLLGKPYGHYFNFYGNGIIKSYRYVVRSGNYSFYRKYSNEGDLKEEMGNPFVDFMLNENKNEADLFFVNVFFDSLHVEISSSKTPTKKLELHKSALAPMLLENKLFINDSLYFLKIYTTKSGKTKLYSDTLNISKN